MNTIHPNPTVNIIFSGEDLKLFLKEQEQGKGFSPLLFNIFLI
jgi:hypothetical protein